MRDAAPMFMLHATLQAFDHRDGQPLEWLSVQFHPTAPLLYGLGRDYRTTVWDIPTGRYLRSIGQTSDWIIAQAISPDGTVLAIGSADHDLVLWDLVHDEPILHMDLGDHVCAVAFSPDGQLLATGHYGAGPIRVWHVRDGRHLATVVERETWTTALAFSPDGHILAAAHILAEGHCVVHLWAVGGWKEMVRMPLTVEVTTLAFHPSARFLTGGAVDGHLYRWETPTGQLAAMIPAHRGRVRAVAYAPTSALLVSGGSDAAVQIWDGATGRLQAALTGHTDAVMGVACDATGLLLASASLDRTVKLWAVDPAEAARHPRL